MHCADLSVEGIPGELHHAAEFETEAERDRFGSTLSNVCTVDLDTQSKLARKLFTELYCTFPAPLLGAINFN